MHIYDEVSYCLRQTTDLDYESFINDETLTRATIRSLEIIGEATKNISSEFRMKYPQVPWKKMAGLRDRLIHQYFGVDYETVWLVLKNDIPTIKTQMEMIIENNSPAN